MVMYRVLPEEYNVFFHAASFCKQIIALFLSQSLAQLLWNTDADILWRFSSLSLWDKIKMFWLLTFGQCYCQGFNMTTMRGLTIFVVFLYVLSLGQCQGSIGCFTQGECLQSLYLEVNRTATPEECLAYCQVIILDNTMLYLFSSLRDLF